MASLLGEHLFEIRGQGPPPPKDFFQLLITKKEVIWRSWKISVRLEGRGFPPKELKTSQHDFLNHKMLKQNAQSSQEFDIQAVLFHSLSVEQVGAVFGQRILEYTVSICQGKFDYLERLPDDILLRILSYLQLKDITLLAQVSQRFRKFCTSEKFWEHTVRTRCAEFTSDMEDVANAMGWRRAFFTLFHAGGSERQQ